MDNQIRYTITANDLLSGKLQGINQNANMLNSTMGNLGGVIAGAFSVYAISSFVKSVVSAGTTVENATTGLTTLLGDAGEATRVIQNTMDDASKTPFAFEGLLSANKALISAGIGADKARADVLNLANAISATGGGNDELTRMVVNMQQISNSGRATSQDIKQFAYAGINIYKVLADATGLPVTKIKEMGVSYDMLTMALQKAHEKGGIYYNGLENMANNTSVRISNVGDALFQFMNDVFVQSKPFIDVVLNSVLSLIAGIRDFVVILKENKDVLTALGVALLAGATAYGIFMVATNLAKIELFLLNGVATVLAGTMFVLENIMTFGIPLAIAVVAGAITYAYLHFAKFRAFLYGTWEALKTVGEMIGQFFTGLKDVIVGAFTFDKDQITKGLLEMSGSFENAGKKIGSGFNKGYSNSMAEFAKEQATDKEGKPKKALGIVKPMAINAGDGTVKDKKGTSGVSGSKVVTVNVTIGNLINDFRIQTTNIQESTTAIKDKVLQALTSAVNDSQLVAGN
jgi:tape measure domain-containing protein